MRRLGDDPIDAVWPGQSQSEGDHRAVAVSPERDALETQSVEHGEGLLSGALMKIHGLHIERPRASVSGPVGHDDPMPSKGCDLPIEWVDPGALRLRARQIMRAMA
jgi:hypothetical protein